MKKTIKIVAVISSPKSNGNTAALVREALKGAEEAGAEIQEIFLPKYNIEFCTGCFKCLAEGKCPISDDFDALKQLLHEADGIIFGSPTYAVTPNAMMKRFMERLGMFERMTSEVFGGKYAIGISTCGGTGAQGVAKDLVKFVETSIFQRGYTSGTLGVGVGPNSVTENPDALHKAHELGKKIVQDIKHGEAYPLQNGFGRMLNAAVIKPKYSEMIQKGKDDRMKGVYGNLHQRGLLA
jgi:multimeric flavodoxin WrbA